MVDANCLFCKIANRQVSAQIVAEADGLVAFRDSNPQAPIHLLIVPREHIQTLAEATDAQTTLLGQALQFANRLAQEHRLMPSGYRIVINCGPQAGQSVWHLHLHLLGGRSMTWPPG